MVARSHVYMKFLLILNHPHAIKDDAQSVLRSLSTLMLIDIKMECESMLLVSTTYVSFGEKPVHLPYLSLLIHCTKFLKRNGVGFLLVGPV